MLSSNVLKRWFFQNNLTGNMIFFVISGKMVILFQRKHNIFFRRKMKDDLSQKIHGNMTIFVYMYKYQIYDIYYPSAKKCKDNLLPKIYT